MFGNIFNIIIRFNRLDTSLWLNTINNRLDTERSAAERVADWVFLPSLAPLAVLVAGIHHLLGWSTITLTTLTTLTTTVTWSSSSSG
jgi:hypothetical protein